MDAKNAADVLGIHDMSGKVQALGEKVHELSERPIVCIPIYLLVIYSS